MTIPNAISVARDIEAAGADRRVADAIAESMFQFATKQDLDKMENRFITAVNGLRMDVRILIGVVIAAAIKAMFF